MSSKLLCCFLVSAEKEVGSCIPGTDLERQSVIVTEGCGWDIGHRFSPEFLRNQLQLEIPDDTALLHDAVGNSQGRMLSKTTGS